MQLPTGSTESGKVLEEKGTGSSQQSQSSEAGQQQQQQASQRPEGIPEKFWKDGKLDTDSLLKSYTELETKLSQPKDQKQQKQQQKEQPKDQQQQQKAEGEATIPTGEELKPYQEEFVKTGELSEESIAKLQKEFKLPRSVIEQYVEGVRAKQDALTNSVFESVGGKDNYAAMSEWAKANLAPEEIAAVNEVIDSGDPAKIKLAVTGLYTRYTQAEGAPAKSRLRGDGGSSNVTPFRSTAEVVEAMKDARYASDPAYRKEVEQRIAMSDVL